MLSGYSPCTCDFGDGFLAKLLSNNENVASKLTFWCVTYKVKWFSEACIGHRFLREPFFAGVFIWLGSLRVRISSSSFPKSFLLRTWAAHQQGTPKTSFSPTLLSTAFETVYWIKISQRLLLCHFASPNPTHLFWPSEALRQFLTVAWVSPNITENRLLVVTFLFCSSE
jgi:hypothetical protein